MPSAFFPNGAGESLGDAFATQRPLIASGEIWYVHAGTGTDASSPAGQNRQEPLATLAQAVSNASDYDMIVLLDGHEETITGVVTLSKSLVIAGGGFADGKPTVKLTNNQATTGSMLSITADNVQLRNIWIEENANATANSSARIAVGADSFLMHGCYIECGPTDTGPAVSIGNFIATSFRSCVFISTATSTSAQPESAIKSTALLNGLNIEDCVFDGGTYGFSNYYAVAASAAAVLDLRGIGVSLLNGADMIFNSSTTGLLCVTTATGGAKVDWA